MKTVFLTGGSTGIGRATVKKFIAEGYQVGFMDIDVMNATSLLAELNSPDLCFFEGDTKVKADIEKAVAKTVERFGGLDVVFANAGIHRANSVLDVTDEEMDLMIKTNIYGTVNTLRVSTPYLVKQGGGAIVINASDQFFVGKANSFIYGLTKGALGQISRSLAIDLGPYNIRVNAVCAGTIQTPLVDKLFVKFSEKTHVSLEEYWKRENSLYARGSAGKPEEVAELVFFLASEKASFITGAQYLVDGGLVAA